ncbi:MAG: glycosyltransferase family 2 protein [Planctomycetaceae bacterium]|nr:glycosyltransferase family 2 protein [Planctomycetaceae bacterium]
MLTRISLVLPVYNEQAVLPLVLPRLAELVDQLPAPTEVIFVNDGSRDATRAILAEAARQYSWLRVVDFSRNFGQQLAITAGLDLAQGDAVVVMDADLQDPPEVVLQMVEQYQAGYDVVYAQRLERHGETWLKKLTATAFYRLMTTFVNRDLPENVSDFRLMSRPVIDALRHLREQHRFMRGLVTWLGFRQTAVQFVRPARAAGETKYSFIKLTALAWQAVVSFSNWPLRAALPVGGGLAALGVLTTMVAGVMWLNGAGSGLAIIAGLQLLLSGATLTAIGVLGDYLGRMYDEVRGRPLYVVRELINFRPEDVKSAERAVLPANSAAPATLRAVPRDEWRQAS